MTESSLASSRPWSTSSGSDLSDLIPSPPFRWEAWEGQSPLPCWPEEPESQVPRIQAYLSQLFSTISKAPQAPTVRFLAEGSWNRAFLVELPDAGADTSGVPPVCRRFVFRLALPVLPDKVRSEVATMHVVRKLTSIPVPRVFLYAAEHNPLEYEWVLMEFMPGSPFKQVKASLPIEAKRQLATTVAEWVHSLAQIRFDAIASLYPTRASEVQCAGVSHVHPLFPGAGLAYSELQVELGPVCDQLYTGEWRQEYPIDHGPFTDLASYCLSFARTFQHEIRDERQHMRSRIIDLRLTIQVEEREIEQAQAAADASAPAGNPAQLAYLNYLKGKLEALEQHALGPNGILDPSTMGPEEESTYDYEMLDRHDASAALFVGLIEAAVPASTLGPGSTFLYHWDISEDNVLVDPATGAPTALLDWEQICLVPGMPRSLPRIFHPPPNSEGDFVTHDHPPSSAEPFDISVCIPIWAAREMEKAYWLRYRELAGFKEGKGNPAAERSLVDRIVEVAETQHWIHPDTIEALVDKYESAS